MTYPVINNARNLAYVLNLNPLWMKPPKGWADACGRVKRDPPPSWVCGNGTHTYTLSQGFLMLFDLRLVINYHILSSLSTGLQKSKSTLI